jgi:hypothetical protein
LLPLLLGVCVYEIKNMDSRDDDHEKKEWSDDEVMMKWWWSDDEVMMKWWWSDDEVMWCG